MPTPTSPLDSLWHPHAITATVLAGEALALVLALSPAGLEDFWVRFGLASLAIQWVGLSTLLAIYLLRRQLAGLSPAALAWCSLVLLLGITALVTWFGLALLAPAVDGNGSGRLLFLVRALAIALVVGLLGLVAFQNYSSSKQLALRAKQAELEALQARIRPHFLFNTLNSVATLLHARPDDAERIVLDLSDLFRAALAEPGWVPLEHELDLCRRYLAVEQQRFGDRLRVEWRLPDAMSELSVPLLTVQPLVENAVAHGLADGSEGRRLGIEVAKSADGLEIVVRNPLPTAGATRHDGHGLGLSGVRARVESATSGQGSVTAGADAEGGTFTARIVLPRASMPAASEHVPDQATIS